MAITHGVIRRFDADAQAIGIPHGDIGRQVLLDGNIAIEMAVMRPVGDAKPADAEHVRDLEILDARSGRQRVLIDLVHGGSRATETVGPAVVGGVPDTT
jgi:hypothetical protein